MNFNPALGAAHALACEAPEEPLTLVAIGGRCGRPHLEVMGSGAGDGVDQRLQRLPVHMELLLCWKDMETERES